MNDKKITTYKNGHWFVFRFRNRDEFIYELLNFVDNPNLDFNDIDAISLLSQLVV